ncbi:MAG: L,D-transpeptidase [Rhodospirillales bacterium]
MDLIVDGSGFATWRGRRLRCAIGRSGIARDKKEGDGATPAGAFAARRVLYRADRLSRPPAAIALAPLDPQDGWCDDPGDAAYNRMVRLPFAGGHERLWRDDGVYDVIVVLGHNDDPVVPGGGSAIFLHVARPDYSPTEGCVALARDDLITVLGEWSAADRVIVAG